MDYGGIEGRVRQWELVDVAKPDYAVCEAGAFEVDAGHGEHLARLVDTERLRYPRRQDFQHAAGAGADIEQVARRGCLNNLLQSGFDLALVDVERTNAMPLRRIVAEIRRGQLHALALDHRQPLQVEHDGRIAP